MGTRPARASTKLETPFRRAGAAAPATFPATARPGVKLLLLLLGVALLSLSFAPIKQSYLALFGLVPWLVVLNACQTRTRAVLWSWLAGTLFFAGNMWWLIFVTVPGAVALVAFLGLYWAGTALLIRETGLLPGRERWGTAAAPAGADDSTPAQSKRPAVRPLLSIFGIAVAWVAVSEVLRCTWPFGGLPWLLLGYTQTPVLAACQIADITGVYGVSFCVMLVNAWVALFFINRLSLRDLLPAGAVVLALIIAVLGYGWYRMSEKTLYPGPTILVVQSNYPQSNTGDKGADPYDLASFHVRTTARALEKTDAQVDLVVWSETMAPSIGKEARNFWQEYRKTHPKYAAWAKFIEDVHETIAKMAADWHVAFLVGAEYEDQFQERPTGPNPIDRRNSAYFYEPDGRQSDLRYDKIHRVPFGEYIPFKETVPWLYRMLISLGPPDMEGYGLQGGDPSHAVVFTLPRPAQQSGEPWRFVTPICFEDIEGPLVAWMFRAAPGRGGPGSLPPGQAPKQADFIVNLTNDGWFKANEMPQHLQAAVFRSIENRAPTARSVNTGISGFIDSLGRIDPGNLIPAGTEGSKIATLRLDHRTTFYTRWGDVFANSCAAAAAIMAGAGLVRWWMERRRRLKVQV